MAWVGVLVGAAMLALYSGLVCNFVPDMHGGRVLQFRGLLHAHLGPRLCIMQAHSAGCMHTTAPARPLSARLQPPAMHPPPPTRTS